MTVSTRRRRPRRTTWHWHLRWFQAGTVHAVVHYTRDDAEAHARRLPGTAADVELFHIDGGGWRTDYPLP